MKNEFQKIKECIPEDKQYIADKLIDELQWMNNTLKKLRNEVDEKGVMEEFVNGKQRFAHDSSALKAYNQTIQRYGNLYKQLCDLMTIKNIDNEEVLKISNFLLLLNQLHLVHLNHHLYLRSQDVFLEYILLLLQKKNIKIEKLEVNIGQLEGLPQNPQIIKDHRFEF